MVAAVVWMFALASLPPIETGSEAAPGIAVSWDAPSTCPPIEVLAARLRQRLAGRGPGLRATIAAQIQSSGPEFALALEVTLEGAAPIRRAVSAPSCEDLTDAAALMIAVAVDPVFVVSDDAVRVVTHADASAARDLPARAPPLDPIAVLRPRAPQQPPPRRRTPVGIALRPVGGAWFGALPRVAPTFGFDVVVGARRSLRAELGVLGVVRQRTSIAAEAGADLWLATAVLRGCFAPAIGRVRPMACLGMTAGALGGRGRGAAVRSTAAREPWISATMATGASVALTRRLELLVRIEGHVHARRPGFHLEGVGSVVRVAPTSVTALAGVQLVLP